VSAEDDRTDLSSAVSASSLYLARFQRTHPDLLAKPSATVLAPSYIDPTATIDLTAKIGPNVAIGPGVKVAAGVRVKDAIIFEGTTLEQHSCVLHSIVGQNCQVGPWARVDGVPEPEDNKGKISVTVLGE
jgi:mannose-1-phosphate guanylyltransferase